MPAVVVRACDVEHRGLIDVDPVAPPGNAEVSGSRPLRPTVRIPVHQAERSEAKEADLPLLREDPLADIPNTRTIDLVLKRGVPYDPDDLTIA